MRRAGFSPVTRHLAALVVCLLVGIFARIPAHAQPPPPIFEPGFEGEIWKTQPPDKIGRRVGPQCISDADWDQINEGAAHENPCVSGPDSQVPVPGVIGPDELYLPVGVAVYDGPGGTLAERRVFVADRYNNRIAVFSPNADGSWNPLYYPTARWNKTAPTDTNELSTPEHIAIDGNGHLWVADLYRGRIAVFNVVDDPLQGRFMGDLVGSIDLGGLLPYGIALNQGGQWGVAGGRAAIIAQDYSNGVVHLIVVDTETGAEVGRHVGGISDAPGDFDQATSVAYHRQGTINRIVVSDAQNNRFQVFDTDVDGGPTGTPYSFGNVALHENNDPLAPEVIQSIVSWPYSVFVDSRGRILASDSGGNRLIAYELVFPASGPFYAKALFQLNSLGGLDGTPRGIGQDADGSLYVVDTGNNEVEVFEIPALAVVDVAVSNAAPQVGIPFTAEFSVMIPYPKTGLGDVTPQCEVSSGPLTKLSDPVAVPGTEPLTPAEGGSYAIVPVGANGGRVYRYSCDFQVNAGGSGDFSIDLFATAGPVSAPRKRAVGHVSDCGGAACEDDPPAVGGAIGPGSDGPYNQAMLDPGVPPDTLGYFKSAVIRLTGDDTPPAGGMPSTGIRRIYWQWLGAPFGQPLYSPCPGAPPSSALECADFTGLPPQAIRTFDVPAEQNGIRKLEFWTEDFSGNVSAHDTMTIAVDSTPPEVVRFVAITPDGVVAPDGTPWWNTDISVKYAFSDNLTANDDITLTPNLRTPPPEYYGIVIVGSGNAEGVDLTASIGMEDLATNFAEYILRDLMENQFNIDRSAPITTPRVGPLPGGPPLTNNQVFTSGPTFTLDATDALSGVSETFYRLDDGPAEQYDGTPIVVGPTDWGPHTLEFWSIDVATNEEFSTTAGVHKKLNFYVNSVPVGVADAATTPQSVAVDIDVLANDLDENDNSPTGDDPLSIVNLTQPAAGRGTVAVVGGKVRYTPSPTFSTTPTTPVSFTYRAQDAHGGTSGVTNVSVTVTNANDPPVAVNDPGITTPEDTPRPIDVLANDTDPDIPIPGDVLSIDPDSLSDPAHGSVTIAGTQILYTPDANYSGPDSFTYRAKDAAGAVSANAATVSITVTTISNAPVAGDDAAATNEDTAVVIDVRGNDFSLDGPLTYVSATQGAHGAVSPATGGTGIYTYTPHANFSGTDTFTYTVRDSVGSDTDTATVTVVVAPVNDSPDAVNDTAPTTSNTAVTVPVLGNDSDPDSPALVVTAVSDPPHGTAVNNLDGTVTYTPDAGYSGPDSFTYTITDGGLPIPRTDTATVSITVSPATCMWIRPGLTDEQVKALNVYQFGVAEGRIGDLGRTGTHEMSLGFTTSYPWRTAQFAWITGQTEPFSLVYDGTSVVFKLGAGSRMKTLTWTGGGHDHDGCDDRDHDEDGDDDEDDRRRFDLNTLLIRARGENAYGTMALSDLLLDGMSLPAFSAPTGSSTAQTLALIGLDEPTFTLTGTARISWTGTWNGSSSRSNKVAFQIMGGHIRNIVGCGGVNKAPVAGDDTATTAEDQSTTIDVLANDSDPDGDPIKVGSVSDPPHGKAVINANGTIKYTPDANFSGTDTFTYTVTDTDKSDTGSVTVRVSAVNDPPVAQNKTASTSKNTAVTVNLLTGASDADDDTLTVRASDPPKGSVVLTGGSAKYTPDRNFTGTDSFTYTVSDGHGGSVTRTVTVTVGTDDDHDDDHDGHHNGDNCDHERGRNGHRNGDNCQHDRRNHDDGRNGHRSGDDCAEDRDHRRGR